MNKKVTLKNLKPFIPLYIMMLPGLIYIFVNNYIPMAGIVVAFKTYHVKLGMFGSHWTGFENFKFLFSTNEVWTIIRNTLLYNIVFIVVNQTISLILAIMITDVASKHMKKLYQSAILLPYLLSYVVVSYIVFAFLSQDSGMFNALLKTAGKDIVYWYQDPKLWPFILVFVNCWKGVGYGALIYIAGITGIDLSLYEAARIDGASKWKQITNVTLPSLIPQVITLVLMAIGHIFASDFGLFYQVPQSSGALFEVTQTIDTYVYRSLMSTGGIGRSAAAGLLQSVVGFCLVIAANAVVRKVNKENAMF